MFLESQEGHLAFYKLHRIFLKFLFQNNWRKKLVNQGSSRTAIKIAFEVCFSNHDLHAAESTSN